MESVKKEIFFAVVLGLIFGIILTLFFTGSINKNILLFLTLKKNETEETKLIKPMVTISKNQSFISIDQANETLFLSSSAQITGKSLAMSKILISTEKENIIISSDKQGKFIATINLINGDNKMFISLLNNFDVNKEIVFHYFPNNLNKKDLSPTSSPISDEKLEKVRQLKEKIANKVMELNLNKKEVYYGEIEKVTSDNFSMITNLGKKIFLTDNNTKINWLNTDQKLLNISYSNLEINDYLVILGFQNDQEILAEQIVGKIPGFFLFGTVKELIPSTNNFSIVIQDKLDPIVVKTNSDSKILTTNKNGQIVTTDFFALKVGSRLLVRGNYLNINKEAVNAKVIVIN